MGKKRKKQRAAAEPLFIRNAAGVEVAVYADAMPSDERVRHLVEHLMEFAPVDAFRIPLVREMTVVDGRQQTARRVMDGIDLMVERGSIGNAAYIAAREYQFAYELAGVVKYGAVDPARLPGGRTGDPAAAFDSRIRAANKLRLMQAYAGDAQSPAFIAVDRIAGRQYSLRKLVGEHGKTRDFWLGCFSCGLEGIVRGYMQGRRNPSVSRGQH